jgi:mediator of RNA polymerase II transcription subunit 7
MSDPQSSAQITNTLFPPPPEYYKQFTDENLERYDELSSNQAGPSRPRSPRPVSDLNENERAELSAEESAELTQLEGALRRPRADWIKEEGRWVTFGEMSTVCPVHHHPNFERIVKTWLSRGCTYADG